MTQQTLLAGVTVVEFEGYLAGSALGMLLTDQGAVVTRIARPIATSVAADLGAIADRGKTVEQLDLRHSADRERATLLAKAADIVIDNGRLGALQPFGLAAKDLRVWSAGLIHVALPAFASDDAEHAALKGYEAIIGATIGLYNDINVIKALFGLAPTYTALPLPSIYAAVQGATAVCAALLAREGSGSGCSIEVPLAAAGAMAMSGIYLKVEGQPRHYDAPRLPKIVKSVAVPLLRRSLGRASIERQDRFYAGQQGKLPAFMSSYPTSDDRLLYLFAIDHRRLAVAALRVLGLPDEAAAKGFVVADAYANPAAASNLAATSALSSSDQVWLTARISSVVATRSAEHWLARFHEAGVPVSLQRTTQEWMRDPDLRVAGITVEGDHPVFGIMAQPGRQFWTGVSRPLERAKDGVQFKPLIGAAAVAPVKGMRVIDFSSMVAGPVAGRTLAELGAEVIKVETPRPLHGPRMTCWYGIDGNQGKQSVLLDLAQTEGREAAARLIATADVVIHNFTSGAAERLMLSEAAVTAINPAAIVCSIGAWDGPDNSLLADRHGYDPVLQEDSGIMTRFGSSVQPELHAIASCVDALTGYSAAFACCAALFDRARSNSATSVRTSLAQSAQLIQLPFAWSTETQVPLEVGGPACRGTSDYHRLYRARDGWCSFAAVSSTEKLAFDAVTAGEGESWFARKSLAGIHKIFEGSAIPVVPVTQVALACNAAARGEHSFGTVTHQHHGLRITQVTPDWLRIDGARVSPLNAAQKIGKDILTVLGDLGFSTEQRDSFVASGAAATQLASAFLP